MATLSPEASISPRTAVASRDYTTRRLQSPPPSVGDGLNKPQLPSMKDFMQDISAARNSTAGLSDAECILQQRQRQGDMGPVPQANRSSTAGSPPLSSLRSPTSLPRYTVSAINNVEPRHGRQPPPSAMEPHTAHPIHPLQSPYPGSSYADPRRASSNSYPSPTQASATSGLYYQRPLPASDQPISLPPTTTGVPYPSPMDQGFSLQQHHHHMSPSASAGFAGQQVDRYVCQTCSKTFSRPSSLKIHIHSHTGEKPFKCPREGCGKAFSVRSNMKRHERGCHSGESPGAS